MMVSGAVAAFVTKSILVGENTFNLMMNQTIDLERLVKIELM
jgi:hypothetical protein